MISRASAAISVSLAVLVLGGCSTVRNAGDATIPQAPGARADLSPLQTHIKHVVIIVQENRSFDNLFAGFPGADAHTSGKKSDGTVVPLKGIAWDGPDLSHGWPDALTAWDRGHMDKFDEEGPPSALVGVYAYSHLARNLIEPYWTMAKRYVLADHMFPTEFGGSFTAHLDLIAGTANLTPSIAEVQWPPAPIWGCDAPAGTYTSLVNSQRQVNWTGGPFPCFTQFKTLANVLDAAGVSWSYYADAVNDGGNGWSSFDAIHDVRYGHDWKNVIVPPKTVLTDISAGKLASVVWVTPDVLDSDHPGVHSGTGPSWVASIVNTIGQSAYWNSTAIVILWDDWGGWYDDAPPPQRDFVGNGIRVPCIIISPYAKPGHVSHTPYEFGSIIKFVEETFGLPALGASSFGYTDTRSASLVDSFDFQQKPTPYKEIPAPLHAQYFLHRKPSNKPADTE